jgi:hypothetical protein
MTYTTFFLIEEYNNSRSLVNFSFEICREPSRLLFDRPGHPLDIPSVE